MIEPPPHPDEEKRLASLRSLNLLDTPLDVRFERITRMARNLLGVPIAIFNLIDEDRQHYKSVQGLDAVNAPKPAAFCTHAILEERMLLVPDAKQDKRFADNPFVTGELLDVRFYAGCSVKAPDGMPIGTLCAIDNKPRTMTPDQLQCLRDLADVIETELKVSSLSHSQTTLIEELDSAKRLAMIDPLTRLWNRSGIDALLTKEINEAIRNKRVITIALGDIDHFKKVNDTHGHPVGDAVLKGVAKRLVDALRAEDIVGRYGGEEFIVILPESQHHQEYMVIDRLRASVEEMPVEMGDKKYNVTMSFGAITAVPLSLDDAEKMIKQADSLLYKAKAAGRNCIKVEEMQSDLMAYKSLKG